jgi:hypothetical protein
MFINHKSQPQKQNRSRETIKYKTQIKILKLKIKNFKITSKSTIFQTANLKIKILLNKMRYSLRIQMRTIKNLQNQNLKAN